MTHKFDPSQKSLELHLYGVPVEFLTNLNYLDNTMKNAINKSGAHIINSSTYKFPGQNSGVSLLYLLSESHGAVHTTPETEPSYASISIATCGNTNPMLGLGGLLAALDPASGKICYFKDGLAIAKRKAMVFPKTIAEVARQHADQFDTTKYCFELQEVMQHEYNIFFYDPTRLTEKMASILGFDWPLTEEAKKPGIKEIRQSIMASQNGHSQPSAVPAKG